MYSRAELNQIRWRSRRGMLELDLLLLPFFEEVFESLVPERQRTFVRLLEEDDPDLLFWFSQKGVPEDAGLRDLVEMILKRVQPDDTV